MTEPNFTPGPWEWRKVGPTLMLGTKHRGFRVVLCADRDSFQSRDARGTLASLTADHPDARLIATAPDLFDLALNVGGTDERLLVTADLHTLRAVLRELIDEARAVLAKARGESQ